MIKNDKKKNDECHHYVQSTADAYAPVPHVNMAMQHLRVLAQELNRETRRYNSKHNTNVPLVGVTLSRKIQPEQKRKQRKVDERKREFMRTYASVFKKKYGTQYGNLAYWAKFAHKLWAKLRNMQNKDEVNYVDAVNAHLENLNLNLKLVAGVVADEKDAKRQGRQAKQHTYVHFTGNRKKGEALQAYKEYRKETPQGKRRREAKKTEREEKKRKEEDEKKKEKEEEERAAQKKAKQEQKKMETGQAEQPRRTTRHAASRHDNLDVNKLTKKAHAKKTNKKKQKSKNGKRQKK